MSGDLRGLQKVDNRGTIDARRHLRELLGFQQSEVLERPCPDIRDVFFRTAQQNAALLKRVTFKN